MAVYTLHVMNSAGKEIRQISPFEMFEWTPSVDRAGRIIYARWDYVDRHNMPFMSLWSTLPDGTNQQAVYGNMTRNPHCVFEGTVHPRLAEDGYLPHRGTTRFDRRQPGRVGSTVGQRRRGAAIAFDSGGRLSRERRLAPDLLCESLSVVGRAFSGGLEWCTAAAGNAGSVSPVGRGRGRPTTWDSTCSTPLGNLTLIYRDPKISSVTPIPVRPRSRPPEISSSVNRAGRQVGTVSGAGRLSRPEINSPRQHREVASGGPFPSRRIPP